MSVEVKVPAVGESISSGVVSVWHKKSGEQVTAGEPLFTLETDKVSTEINADADGVLQALVPEGAEVKIGDVVATIEEAGSAGAKPGSKAEPATQKKSEASKESPAQAVVLSPAARRVVTEEKLDPQEIRGSGKGGRVMKSDAIAAAGNKSAPPEAKTAPPAEKAPDDHAEEKPLVQPESGRFTRRKMSPLRRKIAAQLVMAQHTAAILTTFN